MNPISNDELKALGTSAVKGKTVYLLNDHNEFPAGTAFTIKAAMHMPSRLTYKYLLTVVPEDPSIGSDKIALGNEVLSFSCDGEAPAAPAVQAPVAQPQPVAAPKAAAPAPAAAFELNIPDDPDMAAAQVFLTKATEHPLVQVFWDTYEDTSGPFDAEPIEALEVEYGAKGKDSWTLDDVSRMYFGYCKESGISPNELLYETNKQLEAQRGSAVEKPKGKTGRPPGSKNKAKEIEVQATPVPQPEFRAAEPTPVALPARTTSAPRPVEDLTVAAAPVAAELLKAAACGATFEELAHVAVQMAIAAYEWESHR